MPQTKHFVEDDKIGSLRPEDKKVEWVWYDVQLDDTLERICLQFDVSKDIIRQANQFTGEEIYMFKRLKVPLTG
mgnify:FL=1